MNNEPTITERVRELMQDGEPRTAQQIADALDARAKFVRDVLSRWVRDGHAHVCDYDGAKHAKVFRFGPGENVAMPLLDTKKARHKREKAAQWREERREVDVDTCWPSQRFSDEELDRRHRAPATWWPQADAVVTAAMSAMVRTGGCAHAD